jgi:aminoglycoside 3-N-acetyltransferase
LGHFSEIMKVDVMLKKDQVSDVLSRSGLKAGNHLLVHSSLRSVGPIEGGPNTLIEALLEVIGEAGTLAMPTFNYAFPLPEPFFDPKTVPSKTGALTETFMYYPGTVRSLHPTHSIAARGEMAEAFVADHNMFATFGIGSPIDRIAQAGGYVLLIGVTHLANSCIHVGESHAGVKKFYWRDGPLPVAKILVPDGSVVDYQLDCSASCSRAFNAVEYPLRRRNKILDLTLGKALCFLMTGKDVIETVMTMVRQQPDILFCNSNTCRPCSKGRQHLIEDGRLSYTPLS